MRSLPNADRQRAQECCLYQSDSRGASTGEEDSVSSSLNKGKVIKAHKGNKVTDNRVLVWGLERAPRRVNKLHVGVRTTRSSVNRTGYGHKATFPRMRR